MSIEEYGNHKITPLGRIQSKYWKSLVGIKDEDRLMHIYALGRTGVGKSTLLLNMAISDIARGHGLAIIDPHGDLAQTLLNYVPEHRVNDVIYFDVTDTDFPIAFNPLHAQSKKERYLIASGLISTFKKIWVDSWGFRMEHVLRFTLLALLEYPSATILDISRMLIEDQFRREVLKHVHSSSVRSFWRFEFAQFTPGLRQEVINPIVNKMGLFSANTILRNIVGQPVSSINLGEIMAAQKILICNFSKGVLGEDACSLIGSVLISSLQLAAQRRASTPALLRVPFFLYVDEMHSFISQSFVDILAEMRKYGLSIFLTHQYLEQVHPKIYAAIFGNVGTIISFALGSDDATILSKAFSSAVLPKDLIDLPRFKMYLRLMMDGTFIKPFSAFTLPITARIEGNSGLIIAHTRKYFCTCVEDVENMLLKKSIIRGWDQQSLF